MIWLLQAAATDIAGDLAGGQDAAVKPDEGLLVHMLPYLVLGMSILFCTQAFRQNSGALPYYFLGNVLFWSIPSKKQEEEGAENNTAAALAAIPAAASASGNKKKLRKLQQQQQMAGCQPSSAVLRPGYLLPQLLLLLEFTEELDQLLKAFLVLCANFMAAGLIRIFVTATFPTHTVNFVATVWAFFIYTLHKVEWAHVIIGFDEKLYMGAAGLVGAIVSFTLLAVVPPNALAFQAAAATEEATSRMAALVRSRFKKLPAAELQPFAEAGPLGLLLAVVGGVLAGLLMAPGIRYGRLLQSLLEPPVWAFNFKPSLPVKLLAQAGFALQLLLTPLWITATTEVLHLPAASLPWLRGGLMLTVAVLQALAVPYLLQSFLYSTPLHAHTVNRNPAYSDDVKTKSVKRVAHLTLSQASKVCLQLLFVPGLMLSSALGYLLLSFVSPLAATSTFATQWDKQPSQMVLCVAGFVGWWSSTVFMFWASLGGVLSRLHSATLSS